MSLKELLDKEVNSRNQTEELSMERPDPLLVASKYKDEYISLICGLFGYGKASLIVKFLSSVNFDMLNKSEDCIEKEFRNHYYRFQNSEDITAIFKALRRLKQEDSLNNIFLKGYKKENSVLDGIEESIKAIYDIYEYDSAGYSFLIGSLPKKDKYGNIKLTGNSPYKRWNMFLRWMVRHDKLDMGLWSNIDKSSLILPLDTHTFQVSRKIGLLERKTYDLKSAVIITERLKEFDKNDPVKYDFALYRIGQEKIL